FARGLKLEADAICRAGIRGGAGTQEEQAWTNITGHQAILLEPERDHEVADQAETKTRVRGRGYWARLSWLRGIGRKVQSTATEKCARHARISRVMIIGGRSRATKHLHGDRHRPAVGICWACGAS